MIISWSHKGLKRFFYSGCTSGILTKHRKKLLEQLAFLNAASRAEDMNRPGYAFHKLSGKLSTYYSITVSGGWRLIFAFEDGDALLVDYLNYH